MKFGSLFSGIGGIDLGLERAGMGCVWQVEIDDYCNKVLEKHWPNVERFRDVKEVGKHNLKPVDLIAGGFPCPPVSLAAAHFRKFDEDERWLWDEYFRIIREIRPRWALVENVPGLISARDGRLFGGILRDLASVGYDVEWQMLSASQFGAHHIRKRVFIVAYSESIGQLFRRETTKRIFEESLLKEERGRWWTKDIAGISRRVFKIPEGEIFRDADGIFGRLDELRTLGNAVVPQVAEWIGRRIIEFDSM